MKDPEDRKAFAEALYVVAETLGGKLSDVALEGYWRVLGRLSLASLRIACDRALAECEFMPRPKELLKLARPAPVPPYHLPWRDPVKLLAAPHPRETWPAKEGK
jgi:hypothetical protein